MKTVPVLITAYNRPEKVIDLLDSLRQSKPELIYFSVDGPKKHKKSDPLKTQQVADAVSVIDWECDIRMRVRTSNLGIRKAIPDGVNWVLSENDCVIVLEEDVVVGSQAIEFAKSMLSKFENSAEIGHISLYNVVPKSQLDSPANEVRLSIYPESVAWATWKRAWASYDDQITWGSSVKLRELRDITGDAFGAIQWKLNFLDAKAGRVSTWAYRWISSLWSKKLLTISPNQNLVSYMGADEGSHTFSRLPWQEIPISPSNFHDIGLDLALDKKADFWLSRNVFKETLRGVVFHFFVTLIRMVRKEKH